MQILVPAGYTVATNIMHVGGFVDPLKPEGQVDLSRNLQVATAAIDSAGLCVFTAFAVLDIPSGLEAIPKMIGALSRIPYDARRRGGARQENTQYGV